MAKPAITYGHGYLTDCDSVTGWMEHLTNMVDADASLTALYNDVFKITAKFDQGATDEYVYYYLDNDISLSSDIYTTYLVRYKTSESANGAKAKVELYFSDHSTQTILPSSYSTRWKTVSGTITSGKTIENIRLYADDDGTDGTFYVYYDFILLCEGIFSFPYVHSIDPLHLSNRYADLAIPGRGGDIPQYLGMKSPFIKLSGDMEEGTWGGSKIEFGEFLYRIFHENYNDPWQWFTSDLINCKVTPRDFYISQKHDSNAHRVWNLVLAMYSASSGAESTWNSLQWFGF